MLNKKNATSGVLATLLLLVIAVVCSVILYFWLIPFCQTSPSSGITKEMMRIEAVRLIEVNGKVLSIQIYVRNLGESTIVIDSMYLIKEGSPTPQRCGLSQNFRVEVGEVVCVTGYPRSALPPGVYRVKLVSKRGIEALTTVKLTSSSLASKVFLVTIENDEGNKVVDEDDAAIYEVWVSPYGIYYNVTFMVWAKPGAVINYVRAELFDNQGEHPDWVGGNPYEWTESFTYPDWVGAWWVPVREDEFPVTVVISIEKG